MAWYRLSLKNGLRSRMFPVVNGTFDHPLNEDYHCSTVAYPYNRSSLLVYADQLCDGKLEFFSRQIAAVGNPPNWFRNPFTGQSVDDPGVHWTKQTESNDTLGDIKFIWEPSRFTWAPVLARAYRVSGDRKYLKLLQDWTLDWIEQNPVNAGPNWICGQETSIRLMNFLLSIYILNARPERGQIGAADLGRLPWSSEVVEFFIREHLKRIARNFRYAAAQNNNHATSEAAGMYVGGVFLRQVLHDYSMLEVERLGRQKLERLVKSLIYNDGTFVQHSLTYHRVLLDTLSMTAFWNRLLTDDPLSEQYYSRFQRAVSWLRGMTDDSGDGANIGANDGALFYHLTNCDYRDFRPCLAMAEATCSDAANREGGPWTEAVFWLGLDNGEHVNAKAVNRTTQVFRDGGFVRLQGKDSWGLLRLTSGKGARPSHADALHFDLWMDGRYLLRDAGSFLYHTDPYWEHYFKSTAAHNTVTVDDRDQMVPYTKFLWVDWVHAKITREYSDAQRDIDVFETEHDGYGNAQKGVLHRRAVIRHGDVWVVVDDLIGAQPHRLTLRWRLAKSDWRTSSNGPFSVDDERIKIQLMGSKDVSTHLALDESDPSIAWESLYYGEREAVPCVVSTITASKHRWITLISSIDNVPVYTEEQGEIVFSNGGCKLVLSDLKEHQSPIVQII